MDKKVQHSARDRIDKFWIGLAVVDGAVLAALSNRYVQLKISGISGVKLKKEDADFMQAFSEFLSMKQNVNETVEAFNQRKAGFINENYQKFVKYKKFAQQLNLSLTDYFNMNADVARNRLKWIHTGKKLNKELGGQLSDEIIEKLSQRIMVHSPVITGAEGQVRIGQTTEELFHNFIKHANTPPDGKYFSCLLEDFVNISGSKSLIFMPDNGSLSVNNWGGVYHTIPNTIRIINNNMDNYPTIMHEIYHHINRKTSFLIELTGNRALGEFFDEALSRSSDWMLGGFQENQILSDIRRHYETEAQKLYPDDIHQQAKYAFKKARGHYISIMLAGDEKNISKAVDDFYQKTGAAKSANASDYENLKRKVGAWYDAYQDSYNYRVKGWADKTRAQVNEFLKKNFGPDVEMSEDLIGELNKRQAKLANQLINKKGELTVVGRPKQANRIIAEWKRRGVKLKKTIDAQGRIHLELPNTDRSYKIVSKFMDEYNIHFDDNFDFAFKAKKQQGEIYYEYVDESKKWVNKRVKEYYHSLGIEVDTHPTTGKLRIHPDSTLKYETFLKEKIKELKINEFKLEGNIYSLDCSKMDKNAREHLLAAYAKLDIYPVEVANENKLIIESSEVEHFKLQRQHMNEYGLAELTKEAEVGTAKTKQTPTTAETPPKAGYKGPKTDLKSDYRTLQKTIDTALRSPNGLSLEQKKHLLASMQMLEETTHGLTIKEARLKEISPDSLTKGQQQKLVKAINKGAQSPAKRPWLKALFKNPITLGVVVAAGGIGISIATALGNSNVAKDSMAGTVLKSAAGAGLSDTDKKNLLNGMAYVLKNPANYNLTPAQAEILCATLGTMKDDTQIKVLLDKIIKIGKENPEMIITPEDIKEVENKQPQKSCHRREMPKKDTLRQNAQNITQPRTENTVIRRDNIRP